MRTRSGFPFAPLTSPKPSSVFRALPLTAVRAIHPDLQFDLQL
jgi:hypothetical protein